MDTSDWIAAASAVVALASLITSIVVAVSSRTQTRNAAESAQRSAAALERANERAEANRHTQFSVRYLPDVWERGRDAMDPATVPFGSDKWELTYTGRDEITDVRALFEVEDAQAWSDDFPFVRMSTGDSGMVAASRDRRVREFHVQLRWRDARGEEAGETLLIK